MPSRLTTTPVLTVDVGLIHKVDTTNPKNLFDMWKLFSKCANSLEDGQRLENLSWRLWNRETFCCAPIDTDPEPSASSTTFTRHSVGHYSSNIPELSGSVDSLADYEAIDFEPEILASITTPLDITRPQIKRTDSTTSQNRGRERHITPDDLEKIVISIKEKKDLEEPLPFCKHPYLVSIPAEAQVSSQETLTHSMPAIQSQQMPGEVAVPASRTASVVSSQAARAAAIGGVSARSTTSIVRGFSPSNISTSCRSIPLLNEPSAEPRQAMATSVTTSQAKKPTSMFALGASASGDESYEQESSLENVQATETARKKLLSFTLGGSSNEDDGSLRESVPSTPVHRSSLSNGLRKPTINKKQTSFKDEVATRTIEEESAIDDDVFETDDEDDIDESAIDDDDDSSDWEDSMEDSGKSSVEEKNLFQRVDSRPNLSSRRSLITTMIHQNDRANALAKQASQSTPALQRSRTSSPNGPSVAASPESDDGAPLTMKGRLKPILEVPRTAAQPIIQTTTNSTGHQVALSPKTTRRNMLSTELTQSLRRHLLHERQQRNPVATAALKRRHTSHDVANLKQFPEKAHINKDNDKDLHGSWNQYFAQGLGEYHSKGW